MAVDQVPGGFIGWIQQNGQLVLFFAQLAYWLVLCVAAIWATLLFRKLVQTRTSPETGALTSDDARPPIAAQVSVDEFVE